MRIKVKTLKGEDKMFHLLTLMFHNRSKIVAFVSSSNLVPLLCKFLNTVNEYVHLASEYLSC